MQISSFGALIPVAAATLPPHLDPKNLVSTERGVFIDFDLFAIKPEHTRLIERHDRCLASPPALAIKVEGDADERGSPEHDLALGHKRAQAVVQALKLHGAKDGRMEAVSWGKERPEASGHDGNAWARSRRADQVTRRTGAASGRTADRGTTPVQRTRRSRPRQEPVVPASARGHAPSASSC